MTPVIKLNFKGEEEKYKNTIFIIDFIKFQKLDEIWNVLSYGCFTLTIKY